jgi:3-phosphoshikimate 1-carboxyvinyltransferase
MGASLSINRDAVTISPSQLRGIEIDARDCPDLVPAITALGPYVNGETVIKNAGRLRIKESDRLAAITTELSKMGAKIIELEDSLIIKGPTKLLGADVDSHGDHRIAMACVVAALGAEGLTKINNPECIRKSYPTFIEDMKSLGADMD